MKISNFQKIDNMFGIVYTVNMISKLNVYLHYSTRVLLFYSWTFFYFSNFEFLYNLHCIFNINPVILQHY